MIIIHTNDKLAILEATNHLLSSINIAKSDNTIYSRIKLPTKETKFVRNAKFTSNSAPFSVVDINLFDYPISIQRDLT